MYLIKKITDDISWVGANDRRLALFEGVYPVPNGVSYNAYFINDEKTVLIDTADKAVKHKLTENIQHALSGRSLDYLVVQHVEPDHSAAITDILRLYPDVTLVCNPKSWAFITQFYTLPPGVRVTLVNENETLETGKHTLRFIMAPMVHWPEVMVTYDETDRVLFSADAFGSFGALNGAMFADEVDYNRDFMDEARRYYSNIVGKYGAQVMALLNKAAGLDIKTICPLHGFVWRRDLSMILSKYALWSRYEPEEAGVLVIYASIYGNTENAAEILAGTLCDNGVKTALYDVSMTPAPNIIAAAFKWSHLVFASPTYNMSIFVKLEALLHDLNAHNLQNRTVAIIENGSWAPASGGLIQKAICGCKNIRLIEPVMTIKSALKADQLDMIGKMAAALKESVQSTAGGSTVNTSIDIRAMFKLSYGLSVLTVRRGETDNGCVINTVMQLTDKPLRISITVNKLNYTHDILMSTCCFNVSTLDQSVSFDVIERFGFISGRSGVKFPAGSAVPRASNGIGYLTEHVNSVISAKVIHSQDCGTHTLFVADVTEAFTLSEAPSVTYQYYFDHIKPKPAPAPQKGFVCRICGYRHEGPQLPDGFTCPICKHGPDEFELI